MLADCDPMSLAPLCIVNIVVTSHAQASSKMERLTFDRFWGELLFA